MVGCVYLCWTKWYLGVYFCHLTEQICLGRCEHYKERQSAVEGGDVQWSMTQESIPM